MKVTLGLAGPIFIGFIASMLSSFIGTLLVGNYGALDLAAVAIGSSIIIPVSAASGGVLRATTPAMARHYGQGNLAAMGSCLHQASWLAAGLCVAGVAAILNAEHLYDLMHVESTVRPLVRGYLAAAVWGVPAIIATTVLSNFTGAMSRTRPLVFVGLATLAAHVTAGSILIYGVFGVAPQGAVGAGWASAVGCWAGLLVLLGQLLCSSVCRRTGAFAQPQRPDLREISALFRLGLPIGATVFVKFSIFTVMALMIASLGTLTLAAHQVALNVAELAFMAPISVGSALAIQIGQALGRGDPTHARRIADSGVLLAGGIGASTGLVILLYAEHIARVYTQDPKVAASATAVLLFVAFQQVPESAQVSAGLALTGYKDTKVSFLAILIGYWLVCLPLGHTLGSKHQLGLRGYWIGLLVGLVVVAVLQVGRLKVMSRRALASERPA